MSQAYPFLGKPSLLRDSTHTPRPRPPPTRVSLCRSQQLSPPFSLVINVPWPWSRRQVRRAAPWSVAGRDSLEGPRTGGT